MRIYSLFKELVRSKNLQEFINQRYRDKSKVILNRNIFDRAVTITDEIFMISNLTDTVAQVREEYIFDDIRKEDIVIDIGACIGGFCIPASKLSDNVYAVEPITIKQLKQNIILNQANIDVIETALGNGEIMEIEWQGRAKKIKAMAFSEILSLCGGCDFLKCDCEGGEWFIKPNEIRNIRRIEMEYHRHNVSGNNKKELLDALSEYFEITMDKWEKPVNGLGIIHAKNRNIK